MLRCGRKEDGGRAVAIGFRDGAAIRHGTVFKRPRLTGQTDGSRDRGADGADERSGHPAWDLGSSADQDTNRRAVAIGRFDLGVGRYRQSGKHGYHHPYRGMVWCKEYRVQRGLCGDLESEGDPGHHGLHFQDEHRESWTCRFP